MNVIITLPVELIAEILEGRKTIEIRKRIPQRFNLDCDIVYVCEKGTHKVPIMFSIHHFDLYGQWDDNDKRIADQASIPVQWLNDYKKSCEYISLWRIACVCKIKDEDSAWENLGIEKNPQSFIYSEAEWRAIHVTKYVWNTYIKFDERRAMMNPRSERNWFRECEDAMQEYLLLEEEHANSGDGSCIEKAVQ